MEEQGAGKETLQKEFILIDSLLSIDQYKGPDRAIPTKKHGRDIAEVAATAEALLPKGSARITTAVSVLPSYGWQTVLHGGWPAWR